MPPFLPHTLLSQGCLLWHGCGATNAVHRAYVLSWSVSDQFLELSHLTAFGMKAPKAVWYWESMVCRTLTCASMYISMAFL